MNERPAAGRILPVPELRADEIALPRRRFLRHAALLSGGALAGGTGAARASDELSRNLPPNVPEWSTRLGAPVLASPYGVPSSFEANVRRREISSASFCWKPDAFGAAAATGPSCGSFTSAELSSLIILLGMSFCRGSIALIGRKRDPGVFWALSQLSQ